MGLSVAIETIQKIQKAKELFGSFHDMFDSTELWSHNQQLQLLYSQLLIIDLDLALDRKMEQELWTICFRNLISLLQGIARNRTNLKHVDAQIMLSWFLDTAFGFYLNLLHEICLVFDLELPHRHRNIEKYLVYNKNSNLQSTVPQKKPQMSSLIYICEYCLVHLGDIARYRSQRKQAENFYRQANLLSPTNGQPYNQLALLEASRGNKLGTVYYYVRSIAVKNPFSVANTNLNNTLQAVTSDKNYLTDDNIRFTINDFVTVFLQVHQFINTSANLHEALQLIKILNEKLTALVATQSFSAFKLIQFFVINLYSLNYAVDNTSSNSGLANDEIRVKNLILELLIGALSAYLLPIHTLDISQEDFLNYQALPAVKLVLEWIRLKPEILKNAIFDKHLQIWPSLCKLFNGLWKHHVNDFVKTVEMKLYDQVPLPEDKDLLGYLPLHSIFDKLKCQKFDKDLKLMNKIRAYRLIMLGEWLTTHSNFLTCYGIDNELIFEVKIMGTDSPWPLVSDVEGFNAFQDYNEISNSLNSFSATSSVKLENPKTNLLTVTRPTSTGIKQRRNVIIDTIMKAEKNQKSFNDEKSILEPLQPPIVPPQPPIGAPVSYRESKLPIWNPNDNGWWSDVLNGGSTSNESNLSSQFDEVLDVSKEFWENGFSSSPPVSKGNDLLLSEDNLMQFNNGPINNDKWMDKDSFAPKSNAESVKSDGDGVYSLFSSYWPLDYYSTLSRFSNGNSTAPMSVLNSNNATSVALARLIEEQKQIQNSNT